MSTIIKEKKQWVPRSGMNTFTFSGKVLKKEVKYSAKGNPWGSVRVEIPSKKEEFTTSFFVKVFGPEAEAVNEQVNEGSEYYFTGYVKNNSYMNKEGVKVYSTDFVASKFGPVAESEISNTEEAPF